MSRRHRRAEEEFSANGYVRLATFNAERYRGLVHTPEYVARMARIQRRFDEEHGRTRPPSVR